MVNVVDLMTLQPASEHPHGLSDDDFDAIFTTDKPMVFAFHGYPWLIHRLTYRRTNHDNLHVRGYKEEGTTTTPFDMTVLNDLDRFHLAGDVIDRVPRLRDMAAHFKQMLRNKLDRAQTLHRASTATTCRRFAIGNGPGRMKILVLNGGSSSFKCWYRRSSRRLSGNRLPQPLWRSTSIGTEKTDTAATFDQCCESLPGPVDVVGHRIVHGGRFRDHTILTPEVRAAIAEETDDRAGAQPHGAKAVDTLSTALRRWRCRRSPSSTPHFMPRSSGGVRLSRSLCMV